MEKETTFRIIIHSETKRGNMIRKPMEEKGSITLADLYDAYLIYGYEGETPLWIEIPRQ